MTLKNDLLRKIPSVDEIIDYFQESMIKAPYLLYINAIRHTLEIIRSDIQNGNIKKNIKKHTMQMVEKSLNEISTSNMKNVINGTGIILHTGLGRAPISERIMKNAMDKFFPYTNIELDLKSGKRGERNHHVIELIKSITGSESAIVVNNNAAAVFIMLNSLAEGKEVIISRGEQVEIGGSFRIPDVIIKSGCKMIEVGTTNKTHLKDYQDAINDNTGAIMVAHTSNYKVIGFTHTVELSEIGKLAQKKKIPLLVDLGCGAITDFQKFNLPHEPTVKSYVQSAKGVYSFSGDKLLGGPQAGIICGDNILIRKIHQNPLYRALRCDKLTFSILEEILRLQLTPDRIHKDNLTLELFRRGRNKLKNISESIINKLSPKIIKKYSIVSKQTEVEAGSGSLPLEKLPSIAIVIQSGMKPTELSKNFRMASTPILGYIHGKQFYIDLKAITSRQEKILLKALQDILT